MSHSKLPPMLPQVTDEAGNTPAWVPALGLGMLALIGLVIAARIALHNAEPPPAPEPDKAVAAAPAGDEAAPVAPAAPSGDAPAP